MNTRFQVRGCNWFPRSSVGTPIGSGILDFSIVVSDNSGPFAQQLTTTGLRRAPFTTPPVTSASITPASSAAGWNNSNVTITLNSIENEPSGSGVEQNTYGAIWVDGISNTTSPFASSASRNEWMTTITFVGTDEVGNVEAPIWLDQTPPESNISLAPTNPGWYEVSSPPVCDQADCRIEIAWYPSSPTHAGSRLQPAPGSPSTAVLSAVRNSRNKSHSMAWVYFDAPGTLEISAVPSGVHRPGESGASTTIRPLRRRELLSRMKDITFDGIIISIYLFRFAILSSIWIVTVPVLRRVSDWISCHLLPSRERKVARDEIGMFLRVAQWGGVASYAIWTIGDAVQLAIQNDLLLPR